ncbi:MAG: hypothetical protein WAO61_00265 [Solirubrobacterales bacterium]
MSEAHLLQAPIVPTVSRSIGVGLSSDADVRDLAEQFCGELPHKQPPYASRNWGGVLHSLCSYQGKLKPSIAHFLLKWFTRPGDVVLDPMSGVGTIPLEARRQNRVAVAGDLSELAVIVSRAKLERFSVEGVGQLVRSLESSIGSSVLSLDVLRREEHADFGLNGRIDEYFEERTLREILLARRFFKNRVAGATPEESVLLTNLLHILHGNRPYALSRRSHPVTPLKPTGPYDYRSLIERLETRLSRILDPLSELESEGTAYLSDFAGLPVGESSVDAVITSPPFSNSLRFFTTNWMRLWLCGWGPEEFADKPERFLERRQRAAFETEYAGFLKDMRKVLRPGGLLVMHLGKTRNHDMASRIEQILPGCGYVHIHTGYESVANGESHGLTDKGATVEHGFLFARASDDVQQRSFN